MPERESPTSVQRLPPAPVPRAPYVRGVALGAAGLIGFGMFASLLLPVGACIPTFYWEAVALAGIAGVLGLCTALACRAAWRWGTGARR